MSYSKEYPEDICLRGCKKRLVFILAGQALTLPGKRVVEQCGIEKYKYKESSFESSYYKTCGS